MHKIILKFSGIIVPVLKLNEPGVVLKLINSGKKIFKSVRK